MPEARGDIREIVGQPVFVPLFKLFLAYGPIFRLSFGPKSFVVISDNDMAKRVRNGWTWTLDNLHATMATKTSRL
jgi:beta-ring hydroxylase